ncbi:hypothetical protein WH47_03989 [Habropoda laboriosa]|uniref:Uncharacterized protein n=1 Tax=Habropoda laboriosa TaxID=597456 RepID=A0A0L7QUT1_9HYME|nr:hypothetical protein WH47_03989 [Habropoda laboriosa]
MERLSSGTRRVVEPEEDVFAMRKGTENDLFSPAHETAKRTKNYGREKGEIVRKESKGSKGKNERGERREKEELRRRRRRRKGILENWVEPRGVAMIREEASATRRWIGNDGEGRDRKGNMVLESSSNACSNSNVHDPESSDSVESDGVGQTARQTLDRRSSFGCLRSDMLMLSSDYALQDNDFSIEWLTKVFPYCLANHLDQFTVLQYYRPNQLQLNKRLRLLERFLEKLNNG